MKILMLNYEFPPLGGGASNATKYILKEFSLKPDIKVDLVTSSAAKEMQEERFSENITIYKLPVNKKNIHYWRSNEIFLYTFSAIKLVKKLFKKNKYDLCHAFFGIPCGFIAYLFRKNIPYIVSLRGSDVPGFNKRFSFQYVFLKPIIRIVWRNARCVIANSKGLKNLALETNPEQDIKIIYNGIDINEFKPAGKNDDTIKILCVSRLIKRKGIEYLIKSVPLILNKTKCFKITIVGEGNMEHELKNLANKLDVSKYIEFRGYVKHNKLPSIYSDSNIFVLPSLNEGMSNTVLEAMASGLPIITTDTGGTRELIKDNGIIVPMGDSEAIADAIIRLINDSKLREGMGEKSREIAENMSWKNVAEEYLKIYEKVI
ncbi:hypothetical protein BEH94_03725 [Candidatus Altiarchaeales archaeon WOR_SM1_SCG]|nr:hypothetical protein BEH94_03725 [Candidatus Altiarchaeales archaeon WOR_SM1_SCG]